MSTAAAVLRLEETNNQFTLLCLCLLASSQWMSNNISKIRGVKKWEYAATIRAARTYKLYNGVWPERMRSRNDRTMSMAVHRTLLHDMR